MVFIVKGCYKYGNCAVIFQRQSVWCYIGTIAPYEIHSKSSSIPCPCMWPGPCPCLCIVSFCFLFHIRFRFHVHFHVCFNINMALGMFISNMAIILLIPKGPTRCCGKLKGLLVERGWLKSADNLGASPFKRDLLNDTTFSQTNLDGQSL
jgi:hypothetical protein